MNYEIPEKMKAWVLGNPGELTLEEKPVPEPKRAEVLIHVDAVAICATDLEIIKNGPPALIQGGLPFNKGFTPGHEYMGTIVKLDLELMSIKLVIVLRLRFMPDATVVKDVAKECILLV